MANKKIITLNNLNQYSGKVDTKYVKKAGDSFTGIMNVEGALNLPNSPDNPETAQVTNTYNIRKTANSDVTGLTVVDNSTTEVLRVEGNTVACHNLVNFEAMKNLALLNNIEIDSDKNTIKVLNRTGGGCYIACVGDKNGTAYEKFVKCFGISKAGKYRCTFKSLVNKPTNDWRFNIDINTIFRIGVGNGTVFEVEQADIDAIKNIPMGGNVKLLVYYGSTDDVFGEFQISEGEEEKPYVPYYTGLKNASFKGIKSTGENLFKVSSDSKVLTNPNLGITFDYETQMFTVPVSNYAFSYSLYKLPVPIPAGTTVTCTLFIESGLISSGSAIEVGGYNSLDGSRSWQGSVGFSRGTDLAGIVKSNTFTTTNPITDFWFFYNQGSVVEAELKFRVMFTIGDAVPTKFQKSGLVSTLLLPEVIETGLGTTVDFENQKIVKTYKTYALTGNETWTMIDTPNQAGAYQNYFYFNVADDKMSIGSGQPGLCDRFPVADTPGWQTIPAGYIRFGQANAAIYLMTATQISDQSEIQALTKGMTIRYPLATPVEIPFTTAQKNVGNVYTVWNKGSEKIEGNANETYQVFPTITQKYSIHENPKEAANKAYVNNGLAKKLDKTGGTITGHLVVENGTNTTLPALVVTNNEHTYGLALEDDTYKLGEGSIDNENKFTFNDGEGLPVALRDDSSKFTDNHYVKWSAEGNKFIDGGELSDLVTTEDVVDVVADAVAASDMVAKTGNASLVDGTFTFTKDENSSFENFTIHGLTGGVDISHYGLSLGDSEGDTTYGIHSIQSRANDAYHGDGTLHQYYFPNEDGTLATREWVQENGGYGGVPAGGVPAGGEVGAVLIKNSNMDYDVCWGELGADSISSEKIESIYKKTLDGVPYLDGMWMKNNSLYTANANFKRTDFIEVSPNKEYTLCVYYKNASASGTVSNGKIFDADKNIIADFGDGEGHIINITMPENAKYIQFNVNLDPNMKDDLSQTVICPSAMYYQYTKDTKSLDWLEVNAKNLTEDAYNGIAERIELTADNIPDGTITVEKLDESAQCKIGDDKVTQKHITSEAVKEYGENLLDGATYTDGKYLSGGGGEPASQGALSYTYIPIVGGKEYAITVYDKGVSHNICRFEDADGGIEREFNSQPYYTFTPTDIADNVFIVKAPDEAVTLGLNVLITEQATAIVKEVTRVKKSLDWLEINAENLSENAYNGIAEKIEEKENAVKYKYGDSLNKPFDFTGKTMVAFGDSITQGYTSPNLEVKPDKCYIKLFANKFGMSLDNRGVGGQCLAHTDGNAYTIYKKVTSYTNTATNFIVISGGTNDFNQGKPLGEFGSTDITTVYGALRGMCEHLKNNLPDATVIFITPIPVTKDFPNAILPLNAYRNAIYEIATLYGFNVVDGSDLGLPTESGEWANTMIANGDGCHPTEAGHALYFRGLCGKLL